MTDEQRQKRVEQAQMRVLFNAPFFAPAVAKLPVRMVDPSTLDTAATDGKEIIWNREWFDKLEDKVLPTVLCHEVCHCLLGHLWRAPGGVDWDKWNQATDHAVNLMLKEFSEQIMQKCVADPFPFPDPQDSYCADPAYKGMAEEVIYSKMPQRPKGGKGQGKNGKGSMPSFGEMTQPKPGQGGAQSQPAAKQLARDWTNTLNQMMAAAKARGDVPGGMERMVDELLNPKIPWWEIVRQWTREKAEDDWNWGKPNPYIDEFILPTLDSERVGEIVFATDTSGSIDHTVLAQFQTEKQSCLDEMRPSKLVDIYCDSKVHKVAEYSRGELIDRRAPGGGGTDFRPVFDMLAERQMVPKCLIYLTDLDGTFPDVDPGYPCLWVVYGGNTAKPPFGDVVEAAQ